MIKSKGSRPVIPVHRRTKRTKLDDWNEEARRRGLSYGYYVGLQHLIRQGDKITMPNELPEEPAPAEPGPIVRFTMSEEGDR
jgi:hypothetical protein